MSNEKREGPPKLDGEVWRTEMDGCTFAVDREGLVHCWWPAGRAPVGWDRPMGPTDSEERKVLRAWGLHAQTIVAAVTKLANGYGHGEDCPHRYCVNDCDGEDCEAPEEACDCYLVELRKALRGEP